MSHAAYYRQPPDIHSYEPGCSCGLGECKDMSVDVMVANNIHHGSYHSPNKT